MAAYETLVREHQARVFALVSGILRRREDVEDVAQQVFIKVYLSLKRFDLRATFSTWLYRIAVNECFDYLRKKRARPLVYEADLSEEQARRLDGLHRESVVPSDARQGTELRELLDALLARLSREDRLMLVLKEVQGFSVEELSGMFNLNPSTVKVRLFRARGRLADIYRKRLAGASRGRGGGRRR